MLCAYGFNQATYELTPQKKLQHLKILIQAILNQYANKKYDNDLDFKNDMKSALGNQVYGKNDGAILEAATTMNATLVLIGILGFIACFAFSLGPVMWVMLSELYPIKYRGLAIGVIAFINSFISSVGPTDISLGNYQLLGMP